jgi:single-strand DNA-binding protein
MPKFLLYNKSNNKKEVYFMNTVVLVGRVGRDAEIKYFESGKVKANFSVAVNRWDSKTKSEVADWFNIDVWDKQAEFAGEYVKKGALAAVEGRITKDSWQDKATGNDRESFKVIATNIRLLGGKREVEAF